LGEEYRPSSSSLCSFLHYPVTSSFLGPNILLNTLFSNTLSLRSSLTVSDQVSHPHKTTGKHATLHTGRYHKPHVAKYVQSLHGSWSKLKCFLFFASSVCRPLGAKARHTNCANLNHGRTQRRLQTLNGDDAQVLTHFPLL
jgi:hypothetical protein